MRSVRRVDLDFYGDQVRVLADGAAHLMNERPELIEAWSRENALEAGYADYIRTAFTGNAVDWTIAREMAAFAIKWVIHGLPRVQVAHRLAASIAATNIPSEFCSTVSAPWPFFEVVVPEGLLHGKHQSTILVRSVKINDEHGQKGIGAYVGPKTNGLDGEPGVRILYQHWSSPECIARTGKEVSTQKACAPWREFAKPSTDLMDDDMDDELRRSLDWHMRFVFGVCLELQGSASVRDASRSPADWSRRGAPLPRAWTLALARPVIVDVREHARGYISGRHHGALTKQGIVRGHWKDQPHGPGAAERKFIHIEPYWRGPEDAPIAVRTHILRGQA